MSTLMKTLLHNYIFENIKIPVKFFYYQVNNKESLSINIKNKSNDTFTFYKKTVQECFT